MKMYKKTPLKNRPCVNVTQKEMAEVIQRQGGKIFAPCFTKVTDGSIRVLNCRKGSQKYVKGTGKPAAPGLHKVFSMTQDAWRSFREENVFELRAEGKRFFVVE